MVSLSTRLGEIHGVAAQRRDTVDEQEDVQSGGGGGGRGDSVRTSVRPRRRPRLACIASHRITSSHRILQKLHNEQSRRSSHHRPSPWPGEYKIKKREEETRIDASLTDLGVHTENGGVHLHISAKDKKSKDLDKY